MPRVPKKAALAALIVCVVFAAAAASAQAPPGQARVGEGPGGRTALSSWTLALDPGNRGSARGWQRGGFSGRGVSVPNDVDPVHVKGSAGQRNYNGSVAWYRTSFEAPSAGTYAFSFASANYQATVYVDGTGIASHHGSYLPFEGNARLTAGAHAIVVRIDWRNPAAQSKAGFHRTWFNWGGLNGQVTVREVSESELLEPSIATTLQPGTPDAGQATVTVGVHVHNNGPTRSIAPLGELVGGTAEGQRVPIQFPAQTVAQGQTIAMQTSVTVASPALWSPSHPNLYTLQLSVPAGGGVPSEATPSSTAPAQAPSPPESSYTARVGLRELTWHGGRLFLNGRQLRLHGASLQEDAKGHGDALTSADQSTLISELRAIGANTVRSQHPLAPAMLEKLDAAGIMVWQGIGPVEGASNWYSSTPRLLREAEQQARTAASAAQLHPSIIAWNLVDEVARNGHDAAEVSYVQTLRKWLHEHDPTRMVAVDVWGDHPPTQAGALYQGIDAVAETDYTGWYDIPQESPAGQEASMRARLRAQENTFAGKVLIVSEFGAESNTLNASGTPGSYSFQSSLLARHIRVYAADRKLTGMLVWDLRDYPLVPQFYGGSITFKLPKLKLIEGINQKGLFTYGGSAKPAVATVARLFKPLPDD
ncbi:MAG TPA: glycoside hydrolase family 2 TIM barrel-domain containing protein [Solirubrobacteraceae bacterium]|nr:glycoside hydrolase family 2 TIM barrel-domain containing protein [Solirubrobacteraceae bacterium]